MATKQTCYISWYGMSAQLGQTPVVSWCHSLVDNSFLLMQFNGFLWYTYTQAYIVNVSIASKSQRKLIDSPQRTGLFCWYLSISCNNSFEFFCSFHGNRKHYSVQLPICHIQLTTRFLPVLILLCAKERRTARVDENLSMLRIWRWLYKYKQW